MCVACDRAICCTWINSKLFRNGDKKSQTMGDSTIVALENSCAYCMYDQPDAEVEINSNNSQRSSDTSSDKIVKFFPIFIFFNIFKSLKYDLAKFNRQFIQFFHPIYILLCVKVSVIFRLKLKIDSTDRQQIKQKARARMLSTYIRHSVWLYLCWLNGKQSTCIWKLEFDTHLKVNAKEQNLYRSNHWNISNTQLGGKRKENIVQPITTITPIEAIERRMKCGNEKRI